MGEEKKRFGEILIEAGLINELQLSVALGEQKRWGGRLGSVIVKMGFASEESIASVLEKQLGQSCISLDERGIPPEVLKKVKVEIAKRYCIIPLEFDKGTLTIATSDPTDLRTIDELGFVLGLKVKPVLAIETGIKKAIARHYEGITVDSKLQKSVLRSMESMELVGAEPGSPQPSNKGVSPSVVPSEKRETITSKVVLEALLSLLFEKGLISREELMRKIQERGG